MSFLVVGTKKLSIINGCLYYAGVRRVGFTLDNSVFFFWKLRFYPANSMIK